MSLAENLLNSLAETTSQSTSPINDILVIDAESRTIQVPATETLFGVVTDGNSERKYFRCPRIVGDNIDLTTLNLRVNYRNALGEPDGYIVTDVKVSGDFITFSWKLEGKLFKANGPIYFAVCAVKVDSNGVETCAWNTTLATGEVLEGFRVILTETEEEQARDILQQLLNLLQTRSDEAVQDVTAEGTKQVANVESVGVTQRALIESKGAETLATIPEDYTTTYNNADESLRKKAKAILLEGTGEVICVDDASDDHVRGLKVFGKSTQVTTTGKNLFTVDEPLTFYIMSYDEVSRTVIITPGPIGVVQHLHYLDTPIPSGTTVSITVEFDSGRIYSDSDMELGGYNTDDSGATSWQGKVDIPKNTSLSGLKLTNTFTTTKPVTSFVFFANTGSEITEKMIFRVQYEIGSTPTEYEPYTGGKPAPNPEYPHDIMSLGINGGLNVIVGSRNLFNKNSTNESNSMILFPGTYYCKRFFGGSTETNARLHIKIGDSWKIIESVGKYDNSNIIVEGSAFSWYENKQKLTLKKSYEIFYGLPKGEKLTIAINEYLESYEDDNNSVVSIPRSLTGIPVSSGGNYTDSDGQQWICDEVDFERGVYVKRVSKNVITSDMQVTLKTDRDDCNQIAFELLKYDDTVFVSRSVPGLCNKFKRGLYTVGCFNIGTVADSGWGGKSRITFYVDKSITTVEAFMEYIGDDCVVLTPLATPIETPLTADELDAFRTLHTNYPNTTVLNDSGATMQLLYNADTKGYIEKNYVSRLEYNDLVTRITALENK